MMEWFMDGLKMGLVAAGAVIGFVGTLAGTAIGSLIAIALIGLMVLALVWLFLKMGKFFK